jgi:hypothetical protein
MMNLPVVITGRPDLRAPDWRGNVPGKPMSDQESLQVVVFCLEGLVSSDGLLIKGFYVWRQQAL